MVVQLKGWKYFMSKIFVIGSISVSDRIERVAKCNKNVNSEVRFVKRDPDKTLAELIKNAYKNIFWADVVLAVPKYDGSFGSGTLYEMAHLL